MNQKPHRDGGRICHQRRQEIAITFVRLFAFLLASGCAVAQNGKLSAESQSEIEIAVSNFMEASKAPGLSVAVVQNGEFVWSGGFGMADLESSVPATSQTLYRIGSISKSITATAAMVLLERGKLDLDSPVQKYCPQFPQKQWPITTRELLGHLGGIRYYNVPETPYSESENDPEVGNVHHFDNGIEGGLKFLLTIRCWSSLAHTLTTPRKATRSSDARSKDHPARSTPTQFAKIFWSPQVCCKRVRTIASPSSRFVPGFIQKIKLAP